MSLYLVMSYDGVLSFAAKVTNIEGMLCVRTMRGHGHNILLKSNQEKIVKALTCDLCPLVHPGLLGSLCRIRDNGFRLKLFCQTLQTVSLSNLTSKIIAVLFVVRHFFDCFLMQIVSLP